ncbi:MAG: hypothetical protein ABH873_08730 [Candidatus Firestonebacteria bacterium]
MKKMVSVPILILMIGGCAPAYKIIVKMNPVTDSEENIKDNVKITAVYQDRDNLEKIIPYINRNPYLSENKVLFTVFEIVVENNRDDKIEIDTSKCVLLDGLGNQYNAFSLTYFESLYPATTTQYYTYSPAFNEYSPNVAYTDDYYKKNMAGKTLFKNGDMFSKVVSKGFLVFESVGRESSNITLIIPCVKIFKDNQEIEKIDFKFKFSQEVYVGK